MFFTHGEKRTEQDDGNVTLGKGYLVSRIQVLLQNGRILRPRTMEAEALARELLDDEIRVTQNANETYGAFKTGAHDDLVTALGLATQERRQGGFVFIAEPFRQERSIFEMGWPSEDEIRQAEWLGWPSRETKTRGKHASRVRCAQSWPGRVGWPSRRTNPKRASHDRSICEGTTSPRRYLYEVCLTWCTRIATTRLASGMERGVVNMNYAIGAVSNNDPASQILHRLALPAYCVADAARFAGTSAQTVRRWLVGYAQPGHTMERVLDRESSALLSYNALVEIAFVAALRKCGVKLEAIRRAYIFLSQWRDEPFPFTAEDLRTDGVEVLAGILDNPDGYVAASHHGQMLWREAVKQKVDQFDYEFHHARRWYPRGRTGIVVIDPAVAFGAPTIRATGIPTYALKSRARAGESIDSMRADFGLTEQQVREALRFEGVLGSAA